MSEDSNELYINKPVSWSSTSSIRTFLAPTGSWSGTLSAPHKSFELQLPPHLTTINHTTSTYLMSLVQYSSSDSESGSSSPPRKKVARPAPTNSTSLPPLPASFHSLYASSTRVSTKDDPSLHAGRKRAIPHVEGNWPTHLYLECAFRPYLIVKLC